MSGIEEFEPFVRTYQDMVYAAAVRLLGNRADAEDVAQQVFLKAFQRFDSIRGPGAAAWLRTVTRNACLNHLTRYRRRWRLFSELDDADQEGGYEAALAAPDALDVGRLGEHERLEHALQQLPVHQRVPLVLFHFEQAGYQEIADTLGVSLAKVKTDIHRGREEIGRAHV